MISLYIFALLVGGGLLIASTIGSSDHGHDSKFSDDTGHHDGGHGNAAQILSLRNLTYLLFVFGGVGAALTWKSGIPSMLILLVAVLAGLAIATVAAASFGYLRRTDSGGRDSEESFVGLAGRVVVPIGSGAIGKVQVVRGDRTFELLARPLDSQAGGISDWKSVVIVEMKDGTALVTQLDDPMLQQDS